MEVGVGNTSLGGAVAWYFLVSGSWDNAGVWMDAASRDRVIGGGADAWARSVVGKNASAV